MNKANLKQRWGKYTDTDKLVDDIRALLTECKFRNSEHGVCTMLDTYFTNKEPLIKLFQKSKNYAGDMRIITENEFERENSSSTIRDAVYYFARDIKADTIIRKKEDEFGKTLADYLCTGVTHIKATELDNKNIIKKFSKIKENTDKFDFEGYTKKSVAKWGKFCSVRAVFERIYTSNLTDTNVAAILKQDDTLKVAAGMKTSRAFNHFCNVYGVDKAENYNKAFAKYADLVSGLKRKLKFVMSLNPYDYLTMSFGVNWSSCHSIKTRSMCCGGTLSYMLDSTSIITYCVGKNDDVQKDGKIYRTMFAYGENMLLQSRVYPQGNDGNKDLYAVFRELVQAEMTEMLELKNKAWSVMAGSTACASAVTSRGAHYRDYGHNNSCNISYPMEKADNVRLNHSLVVGHDGICAYCGETITAGNSVSHGSCTIRSAANDVAAVDITTVNVVTTADVFDWLE